MSNKIKNTFALDIGTRNVVGVLGREIEGKLHIDDIVSVEHNTRAMVDGQIHDINKVSQTITEVKEKLESIANVTLDEVAIAAAGRVLKTKISEAFIDFGRVKEITKNNIYTLQMQGVESAKQMLFDDTKGITEYYCVAYTTIASYVDGYLIENIEGHKGKTIKTEIIATFLPRQVIDSLYSSVERTGLKVKYLTLEPISAISVVIPHDLRMLNLALVDIGAGTSDIALTKSGTITAYGMLPIAGDEFSERIVEDLLVDFKTAEAIKRNLSISSELEYTDILGMEHIVPCEKIISSLEDISDRMAGEIAQRILELNGQKAPKAVFCVGGGSQFPGLTDKIADELIISHERVAVKYIPSTGDSEELMVLDRKIENPEYITPVGICLNGWLNERESFIDVSVNDTKVKLFRTKELKVIDAAIKCNYSSNNFIQKNGKDLKFTFNGKD